MLALAAYLLTFPAFAFIAPLPLRAEVAVRISGYEAAYQVTEIARQVWIATEKGAYRLDGHHRTPVLEGLRVSAIAEVDDEVWLGTQQGLRRVSDEGTELIHETSIGRRWVRAIARLGDTLWIGTDKGLFRFRNDQVVHLLVGELVNVIIEARGGTWVGTNRNVYRLKFDEPPVPLFDDPREVTRLATAGGSVWIFTRAPSGLPGPCFYIPADRSVPHSLRNTEGHLVYSAAQVSDETWLATERGVFPVQGDSIGAGPLWGLDLPVKIVTSIDGVIWVGTTDRAYRVIADQPAPLPADANMVDVERITTALGRTWFLGHRGAYRVDPDVRLDFRFSTLPFCGLNILLGRVLRVSQHRYSREGSDAYAGEFEAKLGFILRHDPRSFEEALKERQFVSTEEHILPLWAQEVHVAARDAFGNLERTQQPIPIFVLPWKILAPFGIWAAWWLLALIVLVFAPWSSPCMTIVTAPWVRQSASLLFVPIALSSPVGRQHLLKRYRREFANSLRPSTSASTNPLPTVFAGVLQALKNSRNVQLLAKGETVKSYGEDLAWLLVSRGTGHHSLRRWSPVLLNLELYESDEEIEKGATNKLMSMGGLHDEILAKSFLLRGGFIFLLETRTKLGSQERPKVEQFVDKFKNRNLFVILSSPSEPAFDGCCRLASDSS